jgi:hypothetical protein
MIRWALAGLAALTGAASQDAPPAPPSRLLQQDERGGAPRPEGFVDDDRRVVLSATVAAAPDGRSPIRLEAEVKPQGVLSDGLGTLQGTPVTTPAGLSEVFVENLSDGPYHWRARAVDSRGAASEWVEFDPDPVPDFVIAAGNGPPPPGPPPDPAPPALLSQADRPGGFAAPPGFAGPSPTWIFRAAVSHPEGSFAHVQLEVEIEPAGRPFDGSGILTGHIPDAATPLSQALATDLVPGSYQWRARAVDRAGRRSAWVEFEPGGSGPDFVVLPRPAGPPATPPPLPSSPAQADRPGGDPRPAGFADDDGQVALRALVTGTAIPLFLQVEVKPDGVPFDGSGLYTGTPVIGAGFSEAAAAGLPDGAYRWRARSVDGTGAVSGWIVPGTGPGPDFRVERRAPAPPPGFLEGDGDDDLCGLLGVEFLPLLLLGLRRRCPIWPRRRAGTEPR